MKKETLYNEKSYKGHLLVLSANIIWGLNSPIAKSVLNHLTAFSVTTFRMMGAAAAFWILSLFLPKEKIEKKDRIRIFFAALFAVVFNQGLFIFGLSKTSPIDSSIITTTAPIITMIASAFFLKEPITHKKIIGVIVGALGAITLILSGQANISNVSSGFGNALILTAQFSFAIYLTVFRDILTKYSPVTISKWLFLYASFCFLPLSFNDLKTLPYATIDIDIWLQLSFVVFGATFLAYLFMMSAQKLLRPTLISVYNNIQPIVATLLALALGMDRLGWDKALAISLVFIGVYIVTQSKTKADLEKKRKD